MSGHAQEPAPSRLVVGRITDVLGGPVPGALVRAEVGGGAVVRGFTDAEGVYQVRVPESAVVLRASAKGKAESRRDIAAGSTDRILEVPLRDAAPLIGSVAFIDGTPAVGVAVLAIVEDDEPWRQECTTDAAGAFRIEAAPLGRLVVRMAAPPRALVDHRILFAGAPLPKIMVPLGNGIEVRAQIEGVAAGDLAGVTVVIPGDRLPGVLTRQGPDASGLVRLTGLPD